MKSLEDLVGDFHPNVIMRNMIYDAVDNPVHACSLVNLPGITEEGDDLEREASAQRINNLTPLLPMILACAEWMSRVITEVQIEDNDSAIVDDMAEDVQEAVQQVIRAGVVSTLTAFFEIGLITYPEFA